MPPTLERRIAAILTDSLILLALCTLIFFAPAIWPALAALLVLFVLEALTGATPGKLFASLALRADNGAAPPLQTRTLRAAYKWLPIFLYLAGFFTPSPAKDIFWWSVFVLVQLYATIYYFAVARQSKSAFDLPFGIQIVRRSPS